MKVITIGRTGDHNDIIVNDDKVSRNHLQMIQDDEGNFSVVDLGSTNGTFVNGQRITEEVPLKITDELRIGETILPWQSYFIGRTSPKTASPAKPKATAPKRKKSASASKGWLKYAVVAAIVLLLAGGGIGWIVYQKHELRQKLEAAERDVENKREEYARVKAEYDRAVADAEEKARRAALTNSPEDIAAAQKAKNEVSDLKNQLSGAQAGVVKATQNRDDLTSQLSSKEQNSVEKAPDAADNGAKPSTAQAKEPNKPSDQPNNSKDTKVTKEPPKNTQEDAKAKELTAEMHKILNGWKPLKAVRFSKIMGWQGVGGTNYTKEFDDHFEKLSNTEKKNVIEEMKKNPSQWKKRK